MDNSGDEDQISRENSLSPTLAPLLPKVSARINVKKNGRLLSAPKNATLDVNVSYMEFKANLTWLVYSIMGELYEPLDDSPVSFLICWRTKVSANIKKGVSLTEYCDFNDGGDYESLQQEVRCSHTISEKNGIEKMVLLIVASATIRVQMEGQNIDDDAEITQSSTRKVSFLTLYN